PLYAETRRLARGFETGRRALGSVAALLGVLAVPVPVALGATWAVLPAALLAGSVVADLGMYRFVRARRGVPFLLYFLGVHFLVNLTIAAAVGAGALQWLASRRVRRLYDDCPAPAARPATAGLTGCPAPPPGRPGPLPGSPGRSRSGRPGRRPGGRRPGLACPPASGAGWRAAGAGPLPRSGTNPAGAARPAAQAGRCSTAPGPTRTGPGRRRPARQRSR